MAARFAGIRALPLPVRRVALIGATLLLLLVGWVVVIQAPRAIRVPVDLLLQAAIATVAAVWAWWPTPRHAARPRRVTRARFLVALGVSAAASGQWIVMYNMVFRHVFLFPSTADIGYLLLYPTVFIALTTLTTTHVARVSFNRIVVDGGLVVSTFAALIWYFVLGPIILLNGYSWYAKVIAALYPCLDLVMVVAIMILFRRLRIAQLDGIATLFLIGFTAAALGDFMADVNALYGGKPYGIVTDAGWPTLYICLALVCRWLGSIESLGILPRRTLRPWVEEILPYIPAALIIGAFLLVWRAPGVNPHLAVGITIGMALNVALFTIRQILATLENRAYAQRLMVLNASLEHREAELQRSNAQLEALATTDALTDLLNHRAIMERLEDEIDRARRLNHSVGILYFDLDHFKSINDGYGHPAGDLVLRQLAAILRQGGRSIDTIGRVGGEEFLAILPEADQRTAQAVGERIRASVADALFPIGGGLHLTISVGVAVFPNDGFLRDELIAAADTALLGAKRLGRNQVRRADDPDLATTAGAMAIVEDADLTPIVGVVEALSALVEARDGTTGTHCGNVGHLALQVALEVGCSPAEARMLELTGRLHDIGKVAIPDAILRKPGPLTPAEWQIMRTHPEVGAEILRRIPALRPIAHLVATHHERIDGQGYPNGLAGDAIPLGGRIISVVDTFDAIIADRPYHKGQPAATALAEIQRCAGTQFDPLVAAALDRVLRREYRQLLATAA